MRCVALPVAGLGCLPRSAVPDLLSTPCSRSMDAADNLVFVDFGNDGRNPATSESRSWHCPWSKTAYCSRSWKFGWSIPMPPLSPYIGGLHRGIRQRDGRRGAGCSRYCRDSASRSCAARCWFIRVSTARFEHSFLAQRVSQRLAWTFLSEGSVHGSNCGGGSFPGTWCGSQFRNARIERHGLACSARHRAAWAMHQVLKDLWLKLKREVPGGCARGRCRHAALSVPEAAGAPAAGTGR